MRQRCLFCCQPVDPGHGSLCSWHATGVVHDPAIPHRRQGWGLRVAPANTAAPVVIPTVTPPPTLDEGGAAQIFFQKPGEGLVPSPFEMTAGY